MKMPRCRPAILAALLCSPLSLLAQVAGTLDVAFDPNVPAALVFATAVQPDGKILIGGNFTSVGGQTRNNIARLKADGTVESAATFNPGTGANADVYCVAVQADGKILLAGNFTSVNGQTRNYIARLNADGTLESTATFNPGTGPNNSVLSMAVQSDGKIILGGSFNFVNGQQRNNLARLNADGTLESTATFNPGTGPNLQVTCVAVQADGKILIGGGFTGVNGSSRSHLARLIADGTLESTATFNPGIGANSNVGCFAVQADGKILIGGSFDRVNDLVRNHLARLNVDGTVESTATFNSGTGADSDLYCITVQADGKILLGGNFTILNGQARNRIARLNSDGTVESTATFGSGSGSNQAVYNVPLQADGKILLSGNFSTVNGQTRNHVARLINDPASQSLTVPDNSRVQWARSGAAPEVEQVLFEISTNGGASFTPLGFGTRIAGGWQRTGLTLNGSGLIRARGRTSGGKSSGLVEQTSTFNIDSTPPVLSPVSITSNNANSLFAKVGNTVTLSFAANEPIQTPVVTITGSAATVTNTGGNNWTATRSVGIGTTQGLAALSIAATDLAGNAAAAVTATTNGSSVTVDRTPPVVTLLGVNPQTVEGATAYVEAGATATDAIVGNLTGAIQISGNVNVNMVGSYMRTYTVSDLAGNTAVATRAVNVVDTTPPTITVLGANPATIHAGLSYVDAGATASDTIAGDLTNSIGTVNHVDTNMVGTYTVTYTVSDGYNTATVARVVNVVNEAPIARVATLGAVSGSASRISVAKLRAYATDPDGDAFTIIAVSPNSAQGGTVTLLSGIITYTPPGAYTGPDSFSYTLRDDRGATATGMVNVTVATAGAPSLNVVSITGTADGFLVKFAGIPGTLYVIQYRDTLSDPWQVLNPPGPIAAEPNGLFEFEDKPSPIPPSRFYRATEAP